MSTYTEVVETRDKYRATITVDGCPEAPDGDFFGTVYYGERGDFRRVGAPYKSPDDFADTLDAAWSHYQDMRLIERYLRIWHGVRGFDYFDTQSGKYVNIVTDYDLKVWGWDLDPAQWPVVDGVRSTDPAEHNLDEWQAYSDGDVYFVTVQKRVTWTTEDEDFEDREDWEDIDDSVVGGYYGEKWAREAAIEALGHYADETKED